MCPQCGVIVDAYGVDLPEECEGIYGLMTSWEVTKKYDSGEEVPVKVFKTKLGARLSAFYRNMALRPIGGYAFLCYDYRRIS